MQIAGIIAGFLQLTGPDNQMVQINPAEIVTMRVPRRAEHFAVGTHCIIFTGDGKYTLVKEQCSTIVETLRALRADPPRR